MFSNYIYKPTIFLCGSYIGALTYDFTYNIRNKYKSNQGKIINNKYECYYLFITITFFGCVSYHLLT